MGPGDNSDRFTYWPVRIDRGGDVVAPGDGTDRVQFVDVRDLARFIIDLVEAEASGTYNANGPTHPYTMAEALYGELVQHRSTCYFGPVRKQRARAKGPPTFDKRLEAN